MNLIVSFLRKNLTFPLEKVYTLILPVNCGEQTKTMLQPTYMYFWGKADAESGRWHPLAYHMLDVAAVAREWLTIDSQLKLLFLKLSGLSEFQLIPLLTLAAAWHDLGKATVYFQNKIPEFAEKNNLHWQLAAETRGFDHGAFGCTWIDGWRENDIEFQTWTSQYPFLQSQSFLKLWKAACWHHGKAFIPTDYHDTSENTPKGKNNVFDKVVSLRNELLRNIFNNIMSEIPYPFEKDKDIEISPSFARLFAGFVSVCDWVGSNQDFFPLTQSGDLAKYWSDSHDRAIDALKKTQLISDEKPISIHSVAGILGDKKTPRPVQRALENLIMEEPSLVIVEAPTGEGKTESALFQFARSNGRGFYFGLPTQASANQISGRIESFLKNILKTSEPAILAHGNAWLIRAMAEDKKYNASNSEILDTTAETEYLDWFNSKKRTLLSHYGVGTVDQAMLAALNVKHGFVKLFGLAGKTLIIDEVHAYDSFMLPILEHLLRWCGFLNTSVVLLSATLPSEMKKRLVGAYLNMAYSELTFQKSGYPLLTLAKKENNNYLVQEVDTLDGNLMETRKKETIRIHFATHPENEFEPIIESILDKISDGGNILWICNTVNKAQSVFNQLKQRCVEAHSSVELRLFHSRYTKSDRLQIEKEIELLYGDENKSPNRPHRSILVATQVAEQSLDIDFDFLVTDIAPVDLILQRAGRIFRHERNNRNQNYTGPEILVLLPPEISQLKNFAGVYDKFTVLKTMYELANLNDHKILLPQMYRSLVENVYNETIPENSASNLLDFTLKINEAEWQIALGKLKDEQNDLDLKGRHNLIPPPTYEESRDSALLSEEDNSYWAAKTRDGDETIGLILVNLIHGKYMIGDLELPEIILENINVDILTQMAFNTVSVGSKGFVNLAKWKQVLQPEDELIANWQKKIDKISLLKGKKIILLDEQGEARIEFSKVNYQLVYSMKKGLEIMKEKI